MPSAFSPQPSAFLLLTSALIPQPSYFILQPSNFSLLTFSPQPSYHLSRILHILAKYGADNHLDVLDEGVVMVVVAV